MVVKTTTRRATKAAPAPPRKATPPVITALASFKPTVNAMIYGDPGAGKTPLAGTCPNALMMATEPEGPVSAQRWGSEAQVTVTPTLADVHNTVRWLEAGHHRDFEWLLVDSGTRMQEIVLRDIMVKAHAENSKQSEYVPSMREYQMWQLQFKRYVNRINDLPMNVLWTAHAMRAEDEEGEPLILPMFQGRNGTDDQKAMSIWMSGTVGLLGYLGVNEDDIEEAPHRRLVIQRNGPYMAKDRFDLGMEWIDNPNMAEISELITNSGTRRARKAPATKRVSAQRRG